MPELLVRPAILLLVIAVLWLLTWCGRHFVETQRRRALAAGPANASSFNSQGDISPGSTAVRILAFSSADCRQCHKLQIPALQRVMEAREGIVSVVEIDAPGEPELVQNYHVLTVPTTVVLDRTGRAHAVNYGFANTQRLLEEVDAILAQTKAGSSLHEINGR